jgi:hypothetical protein
MTQPTFQPLGSTPCVPVDLRAHFGRRWRIALDEAARGRWRDPWLFIIPCRHGHLFPVDDQRVGASSDHPGAIARKLRAIPGAEVLADGDDGVNVAVPLGQVADVARIMKPRRVRQASAAQREALAKGRAARKTLDRGAPGHLGRQSTAGAGNRASKINPGNRR